jgi:NADP-dependent aldehyde dehydrogenase
MTITGYNHIGFSKSAKGQNTFTTFNSKSDLSNDVIHHEATMDEINDAVKLASSCYQTYANTSSENRANFLNTIADEILNLGQSLIDVYCLESSLPQVRAEGERARTIGQIRSFAEYIKSNTHLKYSHESAQSDRIPLPKPSLIKYNVPIGPIVVFGSSNFPFAYSTAGGDTASALAAGCPVIVKSHPMHAGTSELVSNAIIAAAQKCGMPNGVFSNLNSSDHIVGKHLVLHEDIKGVGFTGSIKGGRAIMDLAASRTIPIPVFAEMGSVNPVVLFPKAMQIDGVQWAKSLAQSITLGCGQFCTKPGLIFVFDNDHTNGFINLLGTELSNIGDTPMLHPSICEKFNAGIEYIQNANNVSLIYNRNSNLNNHSLPILASTSFSSFIENHYLHQEIFGPYALVVICENESQLLSCLKKLNGQLSATILSQDLEAKNYNEVIHVLKQISGRLVYNGVPTGVEVAEAMTHGGPYPASSDSRFTAVGVNAIYRWLRPITLQSWPEELM